MSTHSRQTAGSAALPLSPRPAPARGFAVEEYAARTTAAQSAMTVAGIDVLLCLSEPTVRYFSGFLTPFWQSPARPWFLLLPGSGKPRAVIPRIGHDLMARTWIDTIECFDCPCASPQHVPLLAAALTELAGRTPRIGLMMGSESALRLPLADLHALEHRLPGATWVDSCPLLHTLLQCKSAAEIDKIRYVCQCTADAFDDLPGGLKPGLSDIDVARRFKQLCLASGADDTPYVVLGSGASGYADIISPPAGRTLHTGDVLMIDTGCCWDGYYGDFDRNFALGPQSTAMHDAYRRLWDAIEAGFAAARPGVSCAAVYHAMHVELYGKGGAEAGIGRAGHGLGMQLTETPSIAAFDHTELRNGMVLTLEPSLALANGRMLVLEENIAIGGGGPAWLTRRAPERLPEIG